MKIKLLMIGKTDSREIESLTANFAMRVSRYINFETEVIPDIKKGGKMSESEVKGRESVAVRNAVAPTDVLVLFDERGKRMSSRDFASFIQTRMNSSVKRLVFLIGGAYGFDDEIYKRADFKISLSDMTFSHQMVRLFATEQIYRAFTIINGEPYHHD